MAYAARLERFTHWYVQLWAESLGKNGKGTTPVAALGPVDQHSQVQLYLGGPRDQLFTVVTVATAGLGPRIDPELAKLAGEPGFGGKTIGDLTAAEGRATAETLAKNGCPVRTTWRGSRKASATDDAFHAGDHVARISGRRRLRPAVEGQILAKGIRRTKVRRIMHQRRRHHLYRDDNWRKASCGLAGRAERQQRRRRCTALRRGAHRAAQ